MGDGSRRVRLSKVTRSNGRAQASGKGFEHFGCRSNSQGSKVKLGDRTEVLACQLFATSHKQNRFTLLRAISTSCVGRASWFLVVLPFHGG
jgi:hypothetical protein